MSDKKKSSLFERMMKVYRFSIIDIDDLKEVKSYTMSIRNLLTLFFFLILMLLLLYTAFIAYTPARRLIPGYGDIEENRKFVELRKQLGKLEEEVESQNVYNEGLRKLLQGQELPDDEKVGKDIVLSDSRTAQPELISPAQMKVTSYTSKLDNIYFVAPVYGTISSEMDISIDHYGVDILAPKNSPIKSIARGVIVESDWTMGSGNTISIQHPHNIISVYKHNSTLLKKVGDFVNAGEAIAVIGNSGTLSSGPHLHFELWYDGVPVNPTDFFSFK